jgi:IS30 family transposase
LDISVTNQKQGVVDARAVYSKILRERGYSLEVIGKSLNKHHSTILHHLKNIDFLIEKDKNLRDRYIHCKLNFLRDKEPFEIVSKKDRDSYMSVVRLKNELEETIKSKNKILNDFVDYIEEYEKQKGYLPSIHDYRHTILPLFNT